MGGKEAKELEVDPKFELTTLDIYWSEGRRGPQTHVRPLTAVIFFFDFFFILKHVSIHTFCDLKRREGGGGPGFSDKVELISV